VIGRSFRLVGCRYRQLDQLGGLLIKGPGGAQCNAEAFVFFEWVWVDVVGIIIIIMMMMMMMMMVQPLFFCLPSFKAIEPFAK
jgi:hypothetical protein